MNINDITATDAALVTRSDSADLPRSSLSLYIGGAGNVRVTTVQGTDIVFTAVPVGTVLPIQARRVWLTNTTATLIVALY